MKKIKNPLILLAFAATAICGLGIASVNTKNVENIQTLASAPSTTYPVVSPDIYYASFDDSGSGDAFLSKLRTFNMQNRKSNISYGSLNGIYCYTDYDPSTVKYDSNGQPYGTKLLSFYSGKSTTSYNKEHVWPNSRGGGSDKGKSGSPYVEDDVYMPRPTITEENSDRGNSAYVEGMCHSSNGWDPVTAFEKTLGVYESIRGECARIIFYCMTVNSKLRLVDDANTDFAGSGGRVTMGKLSDMLKWHLTNPVNEREINRQSGGQYLQGNRNAFVDHRSYACKIWGNTNSTTKSLCDQYNGWTDGDEPTPTKTLVSIAVSGTPTKKTYTAGEHFSTAGLTVTAYYSDSTNENVTDKVTVSPDPLTAGTTSVTLSYETKTAVVNGITVSSGDVPITSLIINNKTRDYFIGQTCTLDITVSPADTTDTISFKSNNTSVATVETNGKVSFKAPGSATITATAKSGVSASITFNVTKAPVHVESVSASLPSNSYYVGDTANIQYSVSPDDADNQDVTFTSSNTSVATVDTNGKVTFKAAGSVVFTIASKEDNTIKDTISVTVSNKPVEDIPVESVSLEIAQPKDKYEIGDTVQLSATITPANATNKTLTYCSSNSSVASVDNNGLVTCKAAGSAIITVTSNNNKTAQITIRVDTGVVPVTGVTISLPKTTYEVGETATVSYEVIPANATNKNVIFDSSNNKIATIDQNGKIEFKSVGTVDFVVRAEDNYSLSGKVTVTVTEPVSTPVEIVVKSVPNKTVYKPNEVFDKTGLVVVENYINGEMKDVTSDVTITLPDMSSAGVKEVKISYNSFSTSFEIVVTEAEISNLSIEKSPLKMNYYKNEQFDPRGLKVTVMVGDDKVDVSGIVTFEYDFESTDRVTIWFKNLKQKIIVTIETGEITDEHKAADFAYVVEDKLTDIKVEDFTLNDWNTLEHYYNTLDDAAKKVLQEQVTEYSGGAVDAAEELSATLKKCVENYDKIYLEHKDEGFNDFMSRSPVAPKKNDDKDKSNNTLLILIGIGAGVIILIVLIIVIAVSASKKSKKKHA